MSHVSFTCRSRTLRFCQIMLSEMRAADRRRTQRRRRGPNSLTPFETNILRLYAEGFNRAVIARMLDRSPKTVSNALTLIKEKTGVVKLRQLAVIARRRSDLDRRAVGVDAVYGCTTDTLPEVRGVNASRRVVKGIVPSEVGLGGRRV